MWITRIAGLGCKLYNQIKQTNDARGLSGTISMTNEKKIEWLLRVGVAGEFFGHGMLSIGGKKDWIGWISQLTHVSSPMATTLLFWVGVVDVALALIILVRPVKPLLLWMAFWGFWTALVRPIVGVGWLDFIERSANWAAPLALFYFYKGRGK